MQLGVYIILQYGPDGWGELQGVSRMTKPIRPNKRSALLGSKVSQNTVCQQTTALPMSSQVLQKSTVTRPAGYTLTLLRGSREDKVSSVEKEEQKVTTAGHKASKKKLQEEKLKKAEQGVEEVSRIEDLIATEDVKAEAKRPRTRTLVMVCVVTTH
jgi:hypothetical protein